MPFPTTSVIDAFTGASWDPSSQWSSDPCNGARDTDPQADPGVGIKTASAGSYTFDQWYTPGTYGPDAEVFVEVTPGAGEITRLYSRLVDPHTATSTAHGYIYQGSIGGTGVLYRVVGATPTALGASWTVNAGATGLGLRVTGTGATVTVDMWEKISGTWTNTQSRADTHADRTVTAGYVGVLGIDTAGATRWKNFGGGTYVTPAAVSARRRPSGLYIR